MACKNKGKDAVIRGGKLEKVLDRWLKDENIQALTQGDGKYWKTFYNEALQLDFDYGRMPTIKEIKRLDVKLSRMVKDIKRKPGMFAEYLYLPENLLSKNPLTKRYFNNLVRTGNFYRGYLEMFTSDIDLMARMIRDGSKESGYMQRFGVNKTTAQREIKKLESQYKKMLVENPTGAEKFYRDHLESLGRTIDGKPSQELEIVQGVYDIITKPELLYLNQGQVNSLSQKYGTTAVQIARLWTGGGKGQGEYTLRNGEKAGMRDMLFELLENGLNNYTKVLRDQGQRSGNIAQTEKKIEQLLQGFKKQKNFYPTQALDIFPTLNKLNEALYSGTGKNRDNLNKTLESVNQVIDNMIDNISVSPHTKMSREDVQRRSKDVVSVIDQYAKDVSRFNFSSEATKHVTKAIQDLGKLKGTKLEEQADFLMRYVSETHSDLMGGKFKNSKQSAIAKFITSWQFASKIGLNFASPIKNATQSLQNIVYFGAKNTADTFQYAKSNQLNNILQREMKKHGVFFVNLEEIAETGDMLSRVELVDGKVKQHDMTSLDWIGDATARLAKKLGKPMQWVENKINRSLTFKIAFVEQHKNLSNNRELILKRMKNPPKGISVEDAVSNEITRRASRFAANAVKDLHYLYDPFAKPKILRNPVGSVLGQYSTYSINFFEYQRKIASGLKDSALAGDWNSPEAWRAYRLFSLYSILGGIIEPLTNHKWSNMINNDTKERADMWYKWLNGTEKERAKTFFGKGPILGTFGGPFVGDLMQIGNITGLSSLGNGEWMSYLTGYQAKARELKDRRLQDSVALLNNNLSKLIFTSIPKLKNGTGFMTVLTNDHLGLWNTPDIKAKREKMLLFPEKYGPDILKPIFRTTKRQEEINNRVAASWGNFSDKKVNRILSENERQRAVEILDNSDWWR